MPLLVDHGTPSHRNPTDVCEDFFFSLARLRSAAPFLTFKRNRLGIGTKFLLPPPAESFLLEQGLSADPQDIMAERLGLEPREDFSPRLSKPLE